ncbi:hypothetical protein CEE45_08585 [Candidatus Heimdallarchaeota archaeon B3_Heim]|nr:MAG: hypothetical protein CEE45_08585 [Candidatus Heimdallarchaeota archaeon B3_Heim]
MINKNFLEVQFLSLILLFSIINICTNSSEYTRPLSSSTYRFDSSGDFRLSNQNSQGSINVSSDDELAAVVIEGLGTKEDPWIIEGLTIIANESAGIFIHNTTKYFVIRDCQIETIRDEYHGIIILGVKPGTASVVNNTCINSKYGILINNSGSSLIVNNICNSNSQGIHVVNSDSCTILNNVCESSYIGIELLSSKFAIVENNSCNANSLYGIHFGGSYYGSVWDNLCTHNEVAGIRFWGSSYCIIENNTCIYNSEFALKYSHSRGGNISNNLFSLNGYDGIFILHSSENVFKWNRLVNNSHRGIYVKGVSASNIFHHNNFIDNNQVPQAYDEGQNTWGWNYWSDYSGTGFYSITGSSNANDPYPLAQSATPGTEIPPGYDLRIPIVNSLAHYPETPSLTDQITINLNISDDSGISNVILYYIVRGEHSVDDQYFSIAMTASIDGTYHASFGPISKKTMIDYYIIAVDASEFKNKILQWGDTIHISETNTTASTSVIFFPSIFLLLIILVSFRLRVRKF